MAPRAIWKGVLTVSLVSIPIKVFAATESSDKLEFHQLHSPCQSRMQQKRWCPTCEREVPTAEIVKGFEFETGKYVLLLDAELDAVQPPSTKVIDLVQFAPAEALPLRAINRAYFLVVDGPADGPADEAFRTLQAAMRGRIGIGKLAIYGREYLVAVGPSDGVLLLYTLHHAAELRDLPMVATSDTYLTGVRAARQLLVRLTRPLDLGAFTDDYRADVKRLISAKIAGHEFVESATVESTPALPLLEALTQSLLAVDRRKSGTDSREETTEKDCVRWTAVTPSKR